ncbi:hypothetical protein P168DRAFT_285892 [Aspergillus campestris IBT 28561]|uniref:Uncharacterized protein n=1 Tax=Aspergillus campestris (strain IBT 28561) TaxID=1392248 RepID=A0A2I1DCT0_ASPC2|nr:uncharacterized protein P168DRAFT_285892 [Aspergillus campestris IBT 28561]PKY07683.1 hypothetical protein P168DRAFT_285892 [Aspergillus campestris IBT 28561]
MQPATADPDTQHDVHVMLLDYLLCINVSRILHSKKVENEELDCAWDLNIGWLIDTIETSSSEEIPNDLRIKIQLLNVITTFYRDTGPDQNIASDAQASQSHTKLQSTTATGDYGVASKAAAEFETLCNVAHAIVSESRKAEITAQFIAQAALEEYQLSGGVDPSKYLTWASEALSQTPGLRQSTVEFVASLVDKGSCADDQEGLFTEPGARQLEAYLLDFVSDLMQVLEPPILIQLERGALSGLSREETRFLKHKVGMR